MLFLIEDNLLALMEEHRFGNFPAGPCDTDAYEPLWSYF